MKKIFIILLIFFISFGKIFANGGAYPNPTFLDFKGLTKYIFIFEKEIIENNREIKEDFKNREIYEAKIVELKKELKKFRDVRLAYIKFRAIIYIILFFILISIFYFFYKNR